MWQYETSVIWREGRQGETHSGGKQPIEVASPPEFGGPRNIWTPEDLLTSSVASCIMTSALFFLDRNGVDFSAYMSNATGTMEKGATGLEFTRVALEVSITIKDESQIEATKKAMAMAEKSCPISKALKCPVEMHLEVNATD